MSGPHGLAGIDERFDEAGFEVPFAGIFEGDSSPPRARCQSLPTGNDKVSCSQQPQTQAKLCAPGSNITCPSIPELWVSSTVEGVPFYYGAVVRTVEGTGGKRKALARVENKNYQVRLTPIAWKAAQRWITSMSMFGMPIAAVITAGAGPYCRCIKTPKGTCRHDNPGGCTGRKLSNHGAGDAIDITGVVWKDHHSVGSTLKVTLMHSWADTAEQAPLLVRINAALRLSFATVIDYTDPGHRDHFHVDTNNGVARSVFGMPAERWFLAGCLRSLGYIQRYDKPPTWADVQPGLAAFARQVKMAVPAPGDKNAWRAIVARVYGCVALGSPTHCRHRPAGSFEREADSQAEADEVLGTSAAEHESVGEAAPASEMESRSRAAKLELFPAWRKLLLMKLDDSIVKALAKRKMRVQYAHNESYSNDLNFDLYPIRINRFPTSGGTVMTPEKFLKYVRLNLNSFLDTSISRFYPYSLAEAALWGFDNPVGIVLKIDIFPDNAAVVVSSASPTGWVFSTVNTPGTGTHPVSGHRSFFLAQRDGTYYFINKGLDMTSSGIAGLGLPIAGSIGYGKADTLWKSLQNKLTKFINANGGEATKETRISERVEWRFVYHRYRQELERVFGKGAGSSRNSPFFDITDEATEG